MKAVEENGFQSKKTDASLYNGQPLTHRARKKSSPGLCRGAQEEGNSQPADTGTKCHSVEAASDTPSIPKDKDGVLVENVHTPNKPWFVLRVSYGRVLKAKEIIDASNFQSKLDDKVIVANGDVKGLIGKVTRIACN